MSLPTLLSVKRSGSWLWLNLTCPEHYPDWESYGFRLDLAEYPHAQIAHVIEGDATHIILSESRAVVFFVPRGGRGRVLQLLADAAQGNPGQEFIEVRPKLAEEVRSLPAINAAD